jgi:aerobic-type carbon monoxide dehydrogenase small subunit (CoxS/CutS family)
MSAATAFAFTVDGVEVEAMPGETIGVALLRLNVRTLHHTPSGAPRGLFCGIGSCYDCYTTVDGVPHERACLTLARPGMRVETLIS